MSGVVGGLFLGGMFAKWPTNAALFVPAIVWEMVIALVTNAPWQDRFLHGQYRKGEIIVSHVSYVLTVPST